MTAKHFNNSLLRRRADNCPLCNQRKVAKKSIYGHPVCKKCFYRFANRRQLGYLVDAIIITVIASLLNIVAVRYLQAAGLLGLQLMLAGAVIGMPLTLLFVMKDGFGGQSPGKWLADMQARDDTTGQPISFGQSFKRNAFLLFGLIPFLGFLVRLILVLIVAVQVGRGYRLGDRFARTRVIWKKYANLPVFGGDALVCEQCGYDLTGNISGLCSECGTPLSERNPADDAGGRDLAITIIVPNRSTPLIKPFAEHAQAFRRKAFLSETAALGHPTTFNPLGQAQTYTTPASGSYVLATYS